MRTIDENIGYIFFSAFVDPPYISRVFDKSMSSFMDAAGIIIDLRGNPGGIGLMAQGMAGWLIAQKDCFLGTTYTRNGEHKLFIYPRPTTYTGPVAVLVDELSGSAAELFASGLKDLGRARVFGSPTEGAALASMIDKLPNGDVFLYAVGDYVSAGGQSLEGVGVTPDVEVTPTRKALLEGRDEVLQAAVDWIRHRG